jgi:fibronectin type 3 domain-containing protein
MFEHRPHLITVRSFMVAVYLGLLAGCGGSGGSADSTAAATAPPTGALMAPASLTATPGNAQASLTWSASSGAASYAVKRSTTSGGPYTQLATATSPSYTDTTVSNGTTYYYVVSAANSGGQSDDSAQASVTPNSTITTPPVPVGLAETAGNAQVSLTWSASSGATSYHVKRATTSGGPYTQVAAPTSTSYTDTSLTNGTTYYYVVSALGSAGESANSAQVTATPLASTMIPATPSGLSATAGNTQVSLVWSASDGATSYHVKRATTNGGPYTQVAAPTSNSYTDTSLTNGTTYYYVVSALDTVGESASSAQVSALPVAPTSNAPPTAFGTWINVTPAGVVLTDTLSCGNFGAETIQSDPAHPSNLYVAFHCQGIWKSTDYGATWSGPINTGTNGATVADCAGGITIPPGSTASAPTIYESCIRGSGLGFWKSADGGVNWTRYTVAPGGSRQDYYPPVVDPYDVNHLLMAAHEQDYLVESVDGGQNWTNVSIASGMLENGGTGEIFFINTGNASSTRGTWLWLAQQSGGAYGTWRTANNGASWARVDKNEHPHGASQIYQPNNNGIVYMAGYYSDLGAGILRSNDYGQTWTHVGIATNETVVVGTSKNVYAMYGWSAGAGQTVDPDLQLAAQPGTGNWVAPATPAGLTQGSHQIRVVNDGTHNILVGAMSTSGVWRYIEP